MEEKRKLRISKFLSYILRHHPESIGISIDEHGWADVKELIEKSKNKLLMDFGEIKYVVDNQNPKKVRLSLSNDFCEIKANSGHSIDVDLELEEVKPPKFLYHGTSESNLKSILEEGLSKQKRHHVHLSYDIETAKSVADRRNGENIVLIIEEMRMRADGYKIYCLNSIYFSDEVPKKYIKILKNEKR